MQIKNIPGHVLFESEASTVKKAVKEAVRRDIKSEAAALGRYRQAGAANTAKYINIVRGGNVKNLSCVWGYGDAGFFWIYERRWHK